MTQRRLRTIVVCATFLLGLFVTSTAAAEDIAVNVSTIYASEGKADVDEELAELESELLSGFKGYNSFQLIDRQSLVLKPEVVGSVSLPDEDESTLQMTYKGRTEDEKLLKLDVGLAGKISAEVKASPGSTFFQAGLLYKDGILILAIQADVQK